MFLFSFKLIDLFIFIEKKILISFLLQLLKNAILDKYDLNESSTWVLSADQEKYEVNFN